MGSNSDIINSENGILQIRIGENNNPNDIRELISMFLPASEYEIDTSGEAIASSKDELKRILYKLLSQKTGQTLNWGILTGVKPLKLYSSLVDEHGESEAKMILKDDYYVSGDSIDLLTKTYETQQRTVSAPLPKSVSIYLGIPFCPSRCAYCSFTSNVGTEDAIKAYLKALHKEILYVAKSMKRTGLRAESIYLGGGTPTTLSPSEIDALLAIIRNNIPCLDDFEFTVEAGRPDTLTKERCRILEDYKVDRISINPQSMNPESLARIGRNHNDTQIIKAFYLARENGNFTINADIIAGLPDEDVNNFSNTVQKMLELMPENLTIHTLSIKKGSELRELSAELCYNSKGLVSEMLSGICEHLNDYGYKPYYLYRQKHMLDNLENVGYALPGTECIYNIRIMEEKQTVIALGAGASTKVFFPSENRIERVFNVSNYEMYIDRIDEMIRRKEEGLFQFA